MSTAERGQQITEFLDSGAWLIAPDRVLTRRAIFENLLNIPATTLGYIFADLRILVVAPALGRIATAVPYLVQSGLLPIQFSVVYLDARIESYGYATARKIVADALRNAFAKVAGIERPDLQDYDEPQTGKETDQRNIDSDLDHGRPN
jgi:hypothetical protein